MKFFLSELSKRNRILYWFGWYNLLLGLLCLLLIQTDAQQILGVSRWLKPMKFFVSVWIMVWTMGWILHYLIYRKSVQNISWLIVVTMFAENFIITIQSIRGMRSHFNVSNPVDGMLFGIMGIMILLFTFVIVYAATLYFRQKAFAISRSYLWGIRLGLIFFIIFSVEGGLMLSRLSHTVGGADGGAGFGLVNWSRKSGDLRVAHFFGLHALQLLPLAGFYVFKKPKQLILFSMVYFLLVAATLWQALRGLPILPD